MYTFNSRVRYSETDTDQLLSIDGIINYMQDCATFHSADTGRDVSYLLSKNLCWILNSWQLIIKRRPEDGENITIGTYAYGYRGMFGYRNSVINDAKGEKCAYANSVWVLVNPENNMPVKVTKDAFIGGFSEPKLDMKYEDRKINIPISLKPLDSFIVLRNQLDSHLHVNNGKYISMAKEYIPDALNVKQLRVQYLKSAVQGDIIIPKTGQINNKLYVSLNSTLDEQYAVLEFEY